MLCVRETENLLGERESERARARDGEAIDFDLHPKGILALKIHAF